MKGNTMKGNTMKQHQMTTTTLTLTDSVLSPAALAPLYCRYERQTSPQRAYVELTEEGRVSADYSGEIGNSTPATVWHNRTLRWAVPSAISGAALTELVQEILPLLERVHAGHSVEWDGSNHVGRLDADADEAHDEIERVIESGAWDETNVVEVDDYFAGDSLADLIHEGETVAQAAARLVELAADEGYKIDGDVEEYLQERVGDEREDTGFYADVSDPDVAERIYAILYGED
jgi:hypothetical protein